MSARRSFTVRSNSLKHGASVLSALALVIAMLIVVTTAPAPAAPGPSDALAAGATDPAPDGDASAEADALAEAAQTGHRVEVVADRSETETVWANPDGTLSSEVSQGPIRVRDGDGGWRPIDLTLQSGGSASSPGTSSQRLVPGASPAEVSFSGSGDGPVATVRAGQDASLSMTFGDGLGAPDVSARTATYPVAGTDPAAVAVQASTDGFAAHVVIPAAPAEAPVYEFKLALDGLTASLDHDVLHLKDASGRLVMESSPLRMWDSHVDEAGDPDHVSSVDASLDTDADGTPVLRLTPSMDFLSDPSTLYPVTVDPDIDSVLQHGDAYVASSAPNATFGDSFQTRVGYDGTGKFRGVEQFHLGRYMGHDVTKATLTMFQYYASTCTAKQTNIYPIKESDMPPGSFSWSNQPPATSSSKWNSSATFNHGATGCAAAAQPFDVTRMVNAFASQNPGLDTYSSADQEDYVSFAVRSATETDPNFDQRFCSMNHAAAPTGHACADYANEPKLSLTYAPDLGIRSSYAMSDHQLNDRTELSVNTENGNAVIKADDVKIHSLGQDLDISRYYNSQADTTPGNGTATTLGPKWKLSVGPDVWLEKKSDYAYDYHDPSGVMFGSFVRKSTTPSSDPDNAYNQFDRPVGGVGGDLVDNTGATDPNEQGFRLIMHDSQMEYLFRDLDTTSGNDNLYLVRIKDRSNNKILFNYATGTHRLTSVTDPSGHSLSFSYTGNLLTTITDTNGPTTRTWVYGYTNGLLTSYTDPSLKTTNYDWTTTGTGGDGMIGTVTDPANGSGQRPQATLSYTSGQLTSELFANNTGSSPASVGYNYAYSSTASSRCKSGDDSSTDQTSTNSGTTDGPGTATYCFRDRNTATDRIKRIIDGNGDRRSTKYTVDQQPSTFTSGSSDAGTATGGDTVATYGGQGLEDQLDKVSDPADSPGGTGTSTVLTYSSDTSLPGYHYLPIRKIDGNGQCTFYKYDTDVNPGDPKFGRLTDVYSGQGGLTCADTAGHHYQQAHNSDGTIAWSTDPNAGATPSAADKTIYSYWHSTDSGYVPGTAGLVKDIQKPSGSCTGTRYLCTSYTYDGLGRIATKTDGRGKITRYSYDKLDRTTQVLLDGATTCVPSASTCLTYVYDAEGDLTSRTDPQGLTTFGYDRLNRQRSIATPDGSAVGYSYNDDGKLTQLQTTVPGGSTQTVNYTYDLADQPKTVANATTGTITLDQDHDGRLNKTVFPTTGNNVEIDRDYTNAGRPKSITVKKVGATSDDLADTTYSFQKPAGVDTNELQNATTTGSITAVNEIVNYAYTDHSVLLSADSDAGAGGTSADYNYTHDAAENVTSEKKASTSTYYGYDEAGQLCWQGTTDGTKLAQSCPSTPSGDTSLGHDNAGNNTGTSAVPLTYNADNQVATIDGRSQAYLDLGNDLRVATDNTAGVTVGLVNSRLGVIAHTKTGTGGGTTYYVRDPDGRILAEYGLAGTYYYVTNYQTSVTELIATDGHRAADYRYSPYGEPTITDQDTSTAATANPWRYVGGYNDIEGDGYTKLGARYSDNHSHFNQPDPKPGSLENPLHTLPYGYSGGDPVNQSDPKGTDFLGISLDATAGLLGVGIGGYLGVMGLEEAAGATTLMAFGLGVFGAVTGGAFVALTLVAVIYGAEAISDKT